MLVGAICSRPYFMRGELRSAKLQRIRRHGVSVNAGFWQRPDCSIIAVGWARLYNFAQAIGCDKLARMIRHIGGLPACTVHQRSDGSDQRRLQVVPLL